MESRHIQYTIRGIRPELDAVLRERAARDGQSLNAAALEALGRGLGLGTGIRHHDLDHLAGTWVDDPEFDRAVDEMDRVDDELLGVVARRRSVVRVALDTNRYRDFCAADPVAVDVVQRAAVLYLPFVTVGQLRAGFLAGTRAQANERVLTQFLDSPRAELLLPSASTTRHYAQLFLHLRRQGTPIPTNDLWIAALVMEHDLQLFSRDAHFDHMPQLPRVS